MSLRDQWERPIQRLRAGRLYRTNPDARAELTALGDEAEARPDMTRDEYLAREAGIVERFSKRPRR